MRLHFQEKPWDLYGAVGYTIVIAAVLLALNVGSLLAILLVLFVPVIVRWARVLWMHWDPPHD